MRPGTGSVGTQLRRSAGLADSPEFDRNFRAWLAALIRWRAEDPKEENDGTTGIPFVS